MDPKDRRIKVHQGEMESLLNLKSLLDHKETVSSYAEQYQKLGWVIQAVNPQDGTNLEVNAGEDPETWVNRLWEPGLSGPKINLGVATGKRSRLMILEVAKGQGESILDQYGQWRSECTATLGADRAYHFYAWDPSPLFDSVSFGATPEFKWYGEGQVVLLPPSFDPEMSESWQWLCPPWEKPPQYPSQSFLRFFQQHLTQEPQPRPEVSLSWQEVYCLVSPCESLLKALSASYPSMQSYYHGILEAAAAVGLNTPEVLLSLLWHAPRGNVRQHPEIWGSLQKLVAEAQYQPNTVTPRGNDPWEMFLDDALARATETSAGSSGQSLNKPDPACFSQRRLDPPPQARAAIRTPFSCRKAEGDSRKG